MQSPIARLPSLGLVALATDEGHDASDQTGMEIAGGGGIEEDARPDVVRTQQCHGTRKVVINNFMLLNISLRTFYANKFYVWRGLRRPKEGGGVDFQGHNVPEAEA